MTTPLAVRPRLAGAALAAFALLVVLAVPDARAGLHGAVPVDGPSADIERVGDAALALDGTGAVVYVRGGHIFASRVVNGTPAAPVRVDNGLEGLSSQPVVAAGPGGRLAVLFVYGGGLWSALSPNGASGFAAPTPVGAGPVSDPAVDMNGNGVAFAVWTQNDRVRAARLSGGGWTGFPAPLNAGAGGPAGQDAGRARVATAGDGQAIATWAEWNGSGRRRVYVRRLTKTGPSAVLGQASVDGLLGVPTGSADSPDVATLYDSDHAWVTWRQDVGGVSRVLARQRVGSALEGPQIADGLGGTPGAGAGLPAIALGGREGLGFVTSGRAGTFVPVGVAVAGARLGAGQALTALPGGALPQVLPAIGDDNEGDGALVWRHGPAAGATVRARDLSRSTLGAEGELSNPAFGAVDPAAGLAVDADRRGDAIAAFVQGSGADRRVVLAVVDRPPGFFAARSAGYQRTRRPRLDWSPAGELWGGVTYTLALNGFALGATTGTQTTPPVDLPDGSYVLTVVARDRRGQTAELRPKRIIVDTRVPSARLAIRGRLMTGRTLRLSVAASDGTVAAPPDEEEPPDDSGGVDELARGAGSGGAGPGTGTPVAVGSGVQQVRIDFGDRTPVVRRALTTHRYRRPGRYLVRVTVRDRAGNQTLVRKRITIARAAADRS